MFGYILPEAGSVLTEKLDVASDLLMLNSDVTVDGRLGFKDCKEVFHWRITVVALIEIDFIHGVLL